MAKHKSRSDSKESRYFRFTVLNLGYERSNCVVDLLPTEEEYKQSQKIVAEYSFEDRALADRLAKLLNEKYPVRSMM